MSNYVYLNSKFDEYYVDDEAYAHIATIVHQHKQCNYDVHHPYSEENPCVGNNICLEHFLKKYRYLTYTGHWEQYRDGMYAGKCAYRFVDAQGYVYVSIEDTTREVSRSTADTLAYYGFTPPEAVTTRSKTVPFYAHYATLYGDLKTASVIVMSYNDYSDKIKGVFLLYKHGPAKALSKKSDLYRTAEELMEASKDAHGQYHLNGSVQHSRYEAALLAVISELESATYDVVLRLKNSTMDTISQDKEEVR